MPRRILAWRAEGPRHSSAFRHTDERVHLIPRTVWYKLYHDKEEHFLGEGATDSAGEQRDDGDLGGRAVVGGGCSLPGIEETQAERDERPHAVATAGAEGIPAAYGGGTRVCLQRGGASPRAGGPGGPADYR